MLHLAERLIFLLGIQCYLGVEYLQLLQIHLHYIRLVGNSCTHHPAHHLVHLHHKFYHKEHNLYQNPPSRIDLYDEFHHFLKSRIADRFGDGNKFHPDQR